MLSWNMNLSAFIVLTSIAIMLGVQGATLLMHIIKIIAHKKYKTNALRCARIIMEDVLVMGLPIGMYILIFVVLGYTV